MISAYDFYTTKYQKFRTTDSTDKRSQFNNIYFNIIFRLQSVRLAIHEFVLLLFDRIIKIVWRSTYAIQILAYCIHWGLHRIVNTTLLHCIFYWTSSFSSHVFFSKEIKRKLVYNKNKMRFCGMRWNSITGKSIVCANIWTKTIKKRLTQRVSNFLVTRFRQRFRNWIQEHHFNKLNSIKVHFTASLTLPLIPFHFIFRLWSYYKIHLINWIDKETYNLVTFFYLLYI